MFFNLLREDSPPCRAVFPCLGLVCCVCCCPPAEGSQPADVVQPDVPEAVRVAPLETPGVFPVSEAEAQRPFTGAGSGPARYALMEGYAFRGGAEPCLRAGETFVRVAVNYPSLQVTYARWKKGSNACCVCFLSLIRPRKLLASDFRWVRIGPDFGFTGYYDAGDSRRPTFPQGAFPNTPIYKSPPESAAKSAPITPVTPSTARAR